MDVSSVYKALWWLLWLIVPLTLKAFHPIPNYILKKLNFKGKFDKLNAKNQLKVKVKMWCTFYFAIAFSVALPHVGLMWDYATSWNNDISMNTKIPFIEDKMLKIAGVLIFTVYVLDMTYYQSHMQYYNWAHHIASCIIILITFDDSLADLISIVSRWFISIFGWLLSARFPLQFASIYYYLGKEENQHWREFWYITGMILHAIFVIGQLSFSIILKINKSWSLAATIFLVLI